MCAQPLSRVPWTVARQAPLPMEFPRQEYWVGCHFLLHGIFPTQGSNPGLLCLLQAGGFFTWAPPGKLMNRIKLLQPFDCISCTAHCIPVTNSVTARFYLFVLFTYFALHLLLLPRAITRLLSCNCESVCVLLYLFVSCFLESTYNFHTSENRGSCFFFFFHFSSFQIIENSWYHWQCRHLFFICSFSFFFGDNQLPHSGEMPLFYQKCFHIVVHVYIFWIFNTDFYFGQ